MGRRIGGSPKAQARFLDRIEGVRSPAVIEVTASPGKRCRFFGFYRDREGRTEQQAAPSVRERGVPTKGRVFTRALMKLGYFSPLALKQAHLSASVNVGSGEPRFLICSPEYNARDALEIRRRSRCFRFQPRPIGLFSRSRPRRPAEGFSKCRASRHFALADSPGPATVWWALRHGMNLWFGRV